MSTMELPGRLSAERLRAEAGFYIGMANTISPYDLKTLARDSIHTVDLPDGRTDAYMLLEGRNDERDGRLDFWITPFAQGLGQPTALRGLAVKEGITKARGFSTPLAVVSNNMVGDRVYDYTGEELQETKNGLFKIQSERILRVAAAEAAGIISVRGWSEGASVAAAVRASGQNDFDMRETVIGESPNVEARSPGKLQKDFRKTGLGPLLDARREGGVKLFNELQGMRVISGAFVRDFGRFIRSSRLPENRALHQGMSLDTIDTLLDRAAVAPSAPIFTVRGLRSTITRRDIDAEIRRRHRGNDIHLAEYGHEVNDNLALLGYLAYLTAR